MGSGRDKKKKAKEKKDGPVVGKGADKTDRKTAKNEEKKERRADKRLAGDEDDLDALLAKFALADKQQKEVVVVADADPPSARVNASFVPYTTPKGSEVIMFGGEFTALSSDKVYVNNQLYRYDVERARWSQVLAPQGPSPRCAHQAFIHKGSMYIWGGEFSSPNQERFMHFRDLWRLELASNEWDQLPLRGGPSARSGHRMVVLPKSGRALLFGGFYDNGRDVKYYNDLWELELGELKWTPVGTPTSGPSPRSGCQMFVVGDTVYVYGGYSKVADEEDEEVEHGRAHDDMWALDTATYKWERVKKAGMAPGPRSSVAMTVHRGRAFLFGGASDNEIKKGEDLSSDFHNDLYQFNTTNRRWFAAEVRPPKDYKQQQQQQQQQQQAAGSSSSSSSNAAAGGGDAALAAPAAAAAASAGSSRDPEAPPQVSTDMKRLLDAGKDKDSAIYRAAVRIQSRFRGYVVRKAYKLYQLGGVVSEILYSPAAYGLDMSAKNLPKPRGRISPQAAVVGNSLLLFGGIVEVGSKEVTLDDMWGLDLAKLDGWQLLKENTSGEEVLAAGAAGSDSEWEDASEEED